CLYFFFQAEDGIRCFHVTGVQTCALPIYAERETARQPRGGLGDRGRAEHAPRAVGAVRTGRGPAGGARRFGPARPGTDRERRGQIGRASCRGREWGSGGG